MHARGCTVSTAALRGVGCVAATRDKRARQTGGITHIKSSRGWCPAQRAGTRARCSSFGRRRGARELQALAGRRSGRGFCCSVSLRLRPRCSCFSAVSCALLRRSLGSRARAAGASVGSWRRLRRSGPRGCLCASAAERAARVPQRGLPRLLLKNGARVLELRRLTQSVHRSAHESVACTPGTRCRRARTMSLIRPSSGLGSDSSRPMLCRTAHQQAHNGKRVTCPRANSTHARTPALTRTGRHVQRRLPRALHRATRVRRCAGRAATQGTVRPQRWRRTFAPDFKMSRQMRPPPSMLGWYTGVTKCTAGGSMG
jgi:hypothetical protein